jgi:hypothetical protein
VQYLIKWFAVANIDVELSPERIHNHFLVTKQTNKDMALLADMMGKPVKKKAKKFQITEAIVSTVGEVIRCVKKSFPEH